MILYVFSVIVMSLQHIKESDTLNLYSLALKEHLYTTEHGIEDVAERRRFINQPVYFACDDSLAVFDFDERYKIVYWSDSLKKSDQENRDGHLVKIEQKYKKGKFVVVPISDYIFRNKEGQLSFIYVGRCLYFYAFRQPGGKAVLQKREVISY